VTAPDPIEQIREAAKWCSRSDSCVDGGYQGAVILGALDAVVKLRDALRIALDCRGPHEGTVSGRGGDPAICPKCEETAHAALALFPTDTEEKP